MADSICVLKVMNMNCQGCWARIKRLLSKINGVRSVVVDDEKELVTVTGQVNPGLLQKKIAEKRKTVIVEVQYFDKNPSVNTRNKRSQKEKEEWHSGCGGGGGGGSSGEGKKDHKCEPYVAPKMDPSVCRDPFCKNHAKKPKITEIIFKTPNIPFQHAPPMNWMFNDVYTPDARYQGGYYMEDVLPPPNARYQGGYYRDDPFNYISQGPIRPPRSVMPPRHYDY